MAKPVKSQWDFGELFPPPPAAAPKALTVSELTLQVKRLLEKQVGEVWVTGEVTNLRAQSSGHIYFTLKDSESQLNCVLFRNEAREARGLLQDGGKVVLRGDLTVYEPRGQYQLRVTAVELQGVGALQQAFERLKAKLNAEGLFAAQRKRALPRYPQRIGIVTSLTGAAIRDVLHVVQRRNPGLEIILAPCRVRGEEAAGEIAAAIRLLNEFGIEAAQAAKPPALLQDFDATRRGPGASTLTKRQLGLDLILVTRGGGSLEDLWAFNEEVVARAIFESKLPVVSAVGHEIDFTISDFVADVRAATPSAAAEIITEGVFASGQFVGAALERLAFLARQQWEDKADEAAQVAGRLTRLHPRRRLNEWLQRLDDLQGGLSRCAKQGARQQFVAWRNLRERLARLRPGQLLVQRRESLQHDKKRLLELARHRLRELRNRATTVEARLRLLGPEQVLARGYSITMDAESGQVIRAAEEVLAGQQLRTRLKSGEVRSKAEAG